MASSYPEAKIDRAAREAEYQALWQVCDRATRKPEYIYGDERLKRSFLEDTCDALMLKRQKARKVHCGTDIDAMVTLHLQREVAGRLLATARMGAPAPVANPMPYMNNGPAFNAPQNMYPANPGPFNGNPAAYNVAQAPLHAMPQPRARHSPSDFDFTVPDATEELRNDMNKVINTLREYAKRIAALEHRLDKATRERDMYKAGTIDMVNADMRKSASVPPGMFHYPVEGIEGLAAAAYPHHRPLTPRSQTQGMDEEGDGTYHPGN
ncbi:hypothetical protein H9Q69_002677 [Fusarium xylarioides]|uniref:Uncharacterized protein n=1 Tax=Fusarium xylarioides TaxID=221167 RepID=A0A9P7LAM3_9HYPO|nr:hypothetical protein H9Q70_009790 [Fusarium xylarioides]KAG5770817.1 hypothetical protein H9Q72_002432 [Fusarium xylarioides]KAG5776651.1 hypothetical protein H9Q73_009686 [Fusarium xylarioides]KAG5798279.1 hypothetical protein H9Q69_002677 [Fusarium xylarioides]KAG5814808.1 hypothetical protein H9Q71_003046 [Fusarium xylarioides]